MTPIDKAKELVDSFYEATEGHWNQVPVSKQCALMAVDECVNAATSFLSQEVAYQKSKEYWYNVKIEILKL